jgi:hypothetical protein
VNGKPLEEFAAERARDGEFAFPNRPWVSTPWLDPQRPFIDEAQEESGDRHNYLSWDQVQARIAGEDSPAYDEAMAVAIYANRISFEAADRARLIRAKTREDRTNGER